ncbi:MAG TPA: cytochrome b562 [Phycisphaerae bacterium]|nr:cytochrome b562 [Phycisphaerae bacterium]
MKKVCAMVLIAMGLGVGVSVWGQEGPPGAPPTTRPMRGQGGPRGGVPTGLGGAMREMEQMYKALKKNAADPSKREESLHNVAVMERDAAIAKVILPPPVQHATGDEKAKKAEDYRTDMVTLMKTLLSLEDAIATKNSDDINKGLDAIKAIMEKGHEEFMPKRDD